MYETSVFKYYVELKKDALTEQGYFDLAKVPRLYVTGAGQFIKKIRLKKRLKQKDIARIIGVSPRSVESWEQNIRRVPLHLLVKIFETLGVPRNIIYSMIEQEKISLRSVKLPANFEQIRDIVKYLSPFKDDEKGRVYLLKCSPENLPKDILSFNMNPRNYGSKYRRIIVNSCELNQFLNTFFCYTSVPKLKPPLTTEVKCWHDDGVDLKSSIVIPSLQSDGCMDINMPKKIYFWGNNQVLHDYFIDAIYLEYNEMPSAYFIRNSTSYVTYYKRESINEIADEVMNLAGNTKTSPAKNGQTVDEYLQEPQPHLNYLIKAPKTEQQIALRIWSSTEGCITIHKIRKGQISPLLTIACTHPLLAKQLQKLAKRHGIRFAINYNKHNWSGVGQLYNGTIRGCINFLKLGGFITDVKIGRSSPYHKGINKDILNLGILEYLKQRQTTKRWSKKLAIDVHHYNINQIIKNKEYQPLDYYIDYFS